MVPFLRLLPLYLSLLALLRLSRPPLSLLKGNRTFSFSITFFILLGKLFSLVSPFLPSSESKGEIKNHLSLSSSGMEGEKNRSRAGVEPFQLEEGPFLSPPSKGRERREKLRRKSLYLLFSLNKK